MPSNSLSRASPTISAARLLPTFPPLPFASPGQCQLTPSSQLIGLAGSSNTTGDDQKKLDVIGNEIFINAMRGCEKVKILVSEEEEEAIIFPGHGRYAVVCDPIDGSSNLDAGVSVGTIFGIFRLSDDSEGKPEEVCLAGTELVASGFTMYGASAQLVLTMKGGDVNGFTLDNALGEFILTHPNVCFPLPRYPATPRY
jgi:fructose-1,6-bisphosphatase I